jgi:hypothetical protein
MAVTVHAMSIVTTTHRPTIAAQRDPATELYERACDLIEAAAGLRDAADRNGNQPAVAATLGCIEIALADIAATGELLAEGVAHSIDGRVRLVLGNDANAVDATIARDLEAAVDAIRCAGSACGSARASAGPLLAGLTVL